MFNRIFFVVGVQISCLPSYQFKAPQLEYLCAGIPYFFPLFCANDLTKIGRLNPPSGFSGLASGWIVGQIIKMSISKLRLL